MSKLRLYGDTSGYVELEAPAVGSDEALVLPASGSLATEGFVDAAVAAIPAIAGIGSNVVQTVKTDHFSTTATTPTIPTGLSVSITPTSSTSKILVTAQVVIGYSLTNQVPAVNLLRGSTSIFVGTGGSLLNATYTPYFIPSTSQMISVTITFLDSPATTSPVVYAPGLFVNTGTVFLNRPAVNADSGSASSITAIEVAA